MKIKRYLLVISAILLLSSIRVAGSNAWFTGKASSSAYSFKTGTMGITGTYNGWSQQGSSSYNIENLGCGESKDFIFTISNRRDTNNISSMDLTYKNIVTPDNAGVPAYNDAGILNRDSLSLLQVAKFDVKIIRYDSTTESSAATGYSNLSYNDFVQLMKNERTLPGSASSDEKIDSYTVTVKIPDVLVTNSSTSTPLTDNDYQGVLGQFNIVTLAKQVNSNAQYATTNQ